MEALPTRALGREGPEVSLVGLGANNFGWRIGLEECRAVVDAALELGVTLIDTADVYGYTESERMLGEVLGRRRERVVLLTKFGNLDDGPDVPKGSRRYVEWAIDRSLARLQTDVIDVYMYHRPDGVTPIGDTVETLGELVRRGKARFVGLSQMDAPRLAEATEAASELGVPLVCVENRLSAARPDAVDDILPLCLEHGLGLLPFLPLESGLLTGKYERGAPPPEGSRLAARSIWRQEDWLTDDMFDRVDALRGFAGERGLTLLEAAIGGLASMPAVSSVIAGATRPEQVCENVAAAARRLGEADLEALRALAVER